MGWTATGVLLPNASYEDTAILPDGAGGVIVFMRLAGADGIPSVMRIDGNGARHAGWPAAGKPLSDAALLALPPIPDFNSIMVPSGADHFIVAWFSPDSGALLMQRFDVDGNVDPNWGSPAPSLFPIGTFTVLSVIPDGAGGVYVVRPGPTVPLGTHVTSAGAVVGTIDTPLNLPGDQYVPSTTFAPTGPDAMIADRAPNGGLLVGWNDTRLSPPVSFRLRWWNTDLTPDTTKPDTGFVYFPGSPHQYAGQLLAIHADGDDAAFLAWSDYHDVGFNLSGDLWMTRVQLPVVTGVPPRPGTKSVVLSAPRPNPARVAVALDVTLPDDSPARVELLDVAGRVVRTRPVEGAGPHAVSFGDLATLAPGLYFARAVTRGATSTTRVVVSR